MSYRSKRYRHNQTKIEEQPYALHEALQEIKAMKSAKFDESLEVHLKLGIDPKKSEQTVRGNALLPHGTGRKVKIALFTESQKKAGEEAGADIVGGKDLVEELSKTKKINFDVAMATPDFMRDLTLIAKLLGTRGLMPSPKNGTITENIKETVKKLKSGQITFRNDDTGNLHQIVGKVSWEIDKLKENTLALVAEIRKAKPKGVKGQFIKSITLTSTMGPGIKITV